MLKIGIDFGTTFSSVSYLEFDPRNLGTEPPVGCYDLSSLKSVKFSREQDEIKTQIAWSSTSEKWIWGDDIETGLTRSDIQPQDLINNFKLGLDVSSKHIQPIRDELQSKVDRLPAQAGVSEIDGLIVIFLRFIFGRGKDFIIDAKYGSKKPTIFDTEHVDAAITVPATWTHRMNQRMKEAAIEADIP